MGHCEKKAIEHFGHCYSASLIHWHAPRKTDLKRTVRIMPLVSYKAFSRQGRLQCANAPIGAGLLRAHPRMGYGVRSFPEPATRGEIERKKIGLGSFVRLLPVTGNFPNTTHARARPVFGEETVVDKLGIARLGRRATLATPRTALP
jgi:hypothetical protein